MAGENVWWSEWNYRASELMCEPDQWSARPRANGVCQSKCLMQADRLEFTVSL